MRKSVFFAALSSLAFFSCQKEMKEVAPEVVPSAGPTSFIVSLPETRTILNDHSVLWEDNDEIQVFGYTEGKPVSSAVFQFAGVNENNQAIFDIKEGQELGEFSDYYAAYPAMNGITVSVKNGAVIMSFPRLNSDPYHFRDQKPGVGQFDPNLSVMTAKYDGNRLVFRYGVGYVKITIPVDGVSKVDINFTNNCLGDKPTYSLETGSLSSLENSSKNITASGSFVKGQSYYLAAIPRSGSYSIGKTEISYTINGQPYKTSTDHFNGKKVEVGKIFNLGCPPVSMDPVIEVSSPSKLDYDAGLGSFTFSVRNPAEGRSVSASLEEGVEWISNLEVSDGTVTFDCETNDSPAERSAVITLSYEGAESVDVTVTQGFNSGSTPSVKSYVLYVDNNKDLVNTNSYFNIGTGTSILDCNDKNNYFGTATSFTINGVQYQYARKLDSSNPLSFTVSDGTSATLKFYCAKRENTKTTTIALHDGSTNVLKPELAWDGENGKAVLYESDLISLTAGKTYTFQKSGDNIGIFYVEVVETID